MHKARYSQSGLNNSLQSFWAWLLITVSIYLVAYYNAVRQFLKNNAWYTAGNRFRGGAWVNSRIQSHVVQKAFLLLGNVATIHDKSKCGDGRDGPEGQIIPYFWNHFKTFWSPSFAEAAFDLHFRHGLSALLSNVHVLHLVVEKRQSIGRNFGTVGYGSSLVGCKCMRGMRMSSSSHSKFCSKRIGEVKMEFFRNKNRLWWLFDCQYLEKSLERSLCGVKQWYIYMKNFWKYKASWSELEN